MRQQNVIIGWSWRISAVIVELISGSKQLTVMMEESDLTKLISLIAKENVNFWFFIWNEIQRMKLLCITGIPNLPVTVTHRVMGQFSSQSYKTKTEVVTLASHNLDLIGTKTRKTGEQIGIGADWLCFITGPSSSMKYLCQKPHFILVVRVCSWGVEDHSSDSCWELRLFPLCLWETEYSLLANSLSYIFFRLHEEQDEPSSPTVASVPLIHNIPELKVSQEVCTQFKPFILLELMYRTHSWVCLVHIFKLMYLLQPSLPKLKAVIF